jgi:polyisoprenoid-binding protein YceI
MSKIDLTKDGSYKAKVKGALTIHGVTKQVEADATFDVKGGKVVGKTAMDVACADYNIEIPALVKEKVAKIVKVTVEAPYAKM